MTGFSFVLAGVDVKIWSNGLAARQIVPGADYPGTYTGFAATTLNFTPG